MADARTLVKLPNEKPADFNKRLLVACREEGVEVTNAALHVIDGEAVVTLFSEMVEATEEDVAETVEEAKAEAKTAGRPFKEDDVDLEEGDLIPENDPVFVQVCRVAAYDDKAGGVTHKFLETVYERAEGQVVKVLKDTGSRFSWGQAPDKSMHWIEEHVTYFAVLYLNPENIEPDVNAEERMAQNLRGGASEAP